MFTRKFVKCYNWLCGVILRTIRLLLFLINNFKRTTTSSRSPDLALFAIKEVGFLQHFMDILYRSIKCGILKLTKLKTSSNLGLGHAQSVVTEKKIDIELLHVAKHD